MHFKRTATSVQKQLNRKKEMDPHRKRDRIRFNNNLMEPLDFKKLNGDCEPQHAGTSAESYVKVCVGGKSYCVRTELYTQEETKMHKFVAASHDERLVMCDDYNDATQEYYFERNSKLADHLMDFFSTGSLHRPSTICFERFKEELDFWEIAHDQLAVCCSIQTHDSQLAKRLSKQGGVAAEEYAPIFDGAFLGNFRLTMWRFLEDPQSSFPAAAFALLSVLFVFTSVLGLILGSMPEFQEDNSMAAAYHNMHNKKAYMEFGTTKFHTSADNINFPDFVYKPTDDPKWWLVVLEYVCIGWFTFEYLIRIIIFPKKWDFAKRTLNVIDLLTILPFYLEIALPLFGVYASKFKELTGAMLVIRVLRVLRMARVFKLARYSSSLQTFGHTLKSSITELSMLSMFLLTGIIFFSTIMYYLERDEPHTDFYSIPAGCWWCVVTMATVGYGDAKPVTTFGKLVATATSICGIIVLAFPISMIVEKFASAQQKAIEDEQLIQAQMSAVANNYLLRRFPTRRKTLRPESRDQTLLSTVS